MINCLKKQYQNPEKKTRKNPEKNLKKQIKRCLNMIIFGVDISSSIYTDNR